MRPLALLALALGLLAPSTATAAQPGWIVSCQYSHSAADDPIVAPEQPGAAHLHDFAAATTTDAFSTPDSLRAGGSTCAIPGDASAYWVPALYVDGVHVPPTATARDALFYYRRVAAPAGTTVATIPDGLKMIIGNAAATSPTENPQLGTDIIFKCGPGSGENLPAPPEQCESGVLVLSLRFPNCWNGTDLDSLDHRSHMAYPVSGRCPATHPVNIPRVESFFRYPVGTGPMGEISFSSGPYWTLHQDFLNAWEPATLQRLVDACINALVDCGKNPIEVLP
jgi:hypothetical protein